MIMTNDIYKTVQELVSVVNHALLEEMVLYRILKGSISATYLEPLKGSIQNPF